MKSSIFFELIQNSPVKTFFNSSTHPLFEKYELHHASFVMSFLFSKPPLWTITPPNMRKYDVSKVYHIPFYLFTLHKLVLIIL